MTDMSSSHPVRPAPLVTREALEAFTQRLVVMPFEGSSLERRLEMLEVGSENP